MSKFIFTLFITSTLINTWAQKNIFLNIKPVFNAVSLQMGTTLTHGSGESYALDHFDYYVSDVIITHDGGQVSNPLDDVYIVEPDNHTLYLGFLSIENIEQVEFTIGVPDRLNTQQGTESADISTYPETHPLSFQLPSMYWGWQFGYMPMIIGGGEGASYFEVHSVGAHMQRQVSLSVIQSDVSETQINMELECHVDRWVNGLELVSSGILHGASAMNQLIMDNVLTEDVFTISQSASILSNHVDQPNIYMNDNQLYYSELPATSSTILILDQLGRQILHSDISTSNGMIKVNSNHSGPAFILCKDDLGFVLEKRTIFIP
ncbi:MAG: hypothetical protein HOK92_05600 [Flavobacteriales bacterium]|nr:hypothetical protein [Flavobacteriales bacterium]